MDRSIEIELRQDIKEIGKTLTEIKEAIAILNTKQNTGVWIFKSIITIVIGGIAGFFGAHFSKQF